jgi:hypothetical protein
MEISIQYWHKLYPFENKERSIPDEHFSAKFSVPLGLSLLSS